MPTMVSETPPARRYRRLDAEHLVSSLTKLDARIRDRFPNAGLARVCQDLIAITRDNTSRAAAIGRRDWNAKAVCRNPGEPPSRGPRRQAFGWPISM